MVKSKLAIASFVLGLVSFVFFGLIFGILIKYIFDNASAILIVYYPLLMILLLLYFIMPLASIISGLIALNYIKKFKLEGRKLAELGIVLGFLTILIVIARII